MKPGLLMLPSAVSDSRVHNILPNRIETDFQFSRASAATRVNHQGLIENVGYFGPELVQNGNFSELGSELVTNGDFATDSNWTKGDGWSINNGKAIAENAGSPTAATLTQSGYSLIIGKTYKVVYTVSDYVKGQVRAQFIGGGTSNLPNVSANGTYTEYFVAVYNSTTFRFRAATTDGGFTGSIDNVSVKQVDPNDRWSLGTGWSYGTNKAEKTAGTGSILSQANVVEANKKYKVSFDVVATAGYIDSVFIGGESNGTNITASGSYSYIFDTTNTDNLGFNANSAFAGSVTNISVVEVQGDRPRLDYDPTNPTCPHLLLEPQSTNLYKYSENVSAWSLVSNVTRTASYTQSPEGLNNATRLQFTSNGYIANETITSGTQYTVSVYAKRNDTGTQSFGFFVDGSGNVDSEMSLTSEWQRFNFTHTATNGSFVGLAGLSGADVSVYGMQLEVRSYATSYIPTAGTTITRVGETCNNAGNVDTFNSEEGVLYAEIAALANDGTYRELGMSGGSTLNRVLISYTNTSNQVRFQVKSSNVEQAVIFSTASYNVTDFLKIAAKYKANDFKLYINGVLIGTDTSGAAPIGLSEFSLDSGSGGDDFYGKVKSLATYNRALTDNELYTITSTQYSAYSGMVAALGNYTIPC